MRKTSVMAASTMVLALGGCIDRDTAELDDELPLTVRREDAAYTYDVTDCKPGRNYCAKPDDNGDDTAAIQKAIADILARKKQQTPNGTKVSNESLTLYFPAGTYRVSDSLTFGDEVVIYDTPKGPSQHELQQRIHVKGDGVDKTIVRLVAGSLLCVASQQDPCPGRPVFSFFDGTSGNDLYGNTIEDLSIFVANSNPAAIGLRYANNNYGYVRRVKLTAAEDTGKIGLDLGSNLSGIGLVKQLEVEGFDIGILNRGGTKHTYVLEDVKLSEQRTAGILTKDKGLAVRALTSTNRVPAVVQDGQGSAQLTIVDSTLQGGGAQQAAIEIRNGTVLARNIDVAGYGKRLVKPDGSDIATPGGPSRIGEFVSGPTYKVFADAPDKMLGLAAPATPTVPADLAKNTYFVDGDKQDDDTDAIQDAIDSGKTTVMLKRGDYLISRPIILGGPKSKVRRFDANWSFIATTEAMATGPKTFMFRFTDGASGASDTLVIEAVERRIFDYPKHKEQDQVCFIEHDTARTLVMQDLHLINCAYRVGTKGPGSLFVENVVAGGSDSLKNSGWVFERGQKVWARQLNHEGGSPNLVNDGAQVWIFGSKLGETSTGSYIAVTNGVSEYLGMVFNRRSTNHPPDSTAIHVANSKVAINAFETGPGFPIMVEERSGADVGTLPGSALPERFGGHFVPLYRSRGNL